MTYGLLFITVMCVGQGLQQCKAELRSTLKAINSKEFPQGKTVYAMEYTSRTYRWGSVFPTLESHATMAMANDKIIYTDDNYEMYQDLKDVFMVMHPKKMIIRSNSVIYQDREQKLNQVVSFRDTLIDRLQPTGCELVDIDGKKYKHVTLRADQVTKRKLHVEEMQFTFDQQAKTLKKVKVDYSKNHQDKMMVVEYKTMDFNANKRLKTTAQEYVMNKSGDKPLSKYKTYQWIDER